jgi:hypothetical protein
MLTEPPICSAVGSGLVLNRAVQIWAFCASRAGRAVVFAGYFLAGPPGWLPVV